MDEITDLQLNYDEIVSEKERLEAIWSAAREREEQLMTQLHSVLGELKQLEEKLAKQDCLILQQKELLKGRAHEGVTIEQGLSLNAGGVPDKMDRERADDCCELMANRSLIVGKVSTSKIEVCVFAVH